MQKLHRITASRAWLVGRAIEFCGLACCAALIALAMGSSLFHAQSAPVTAATPSVKSSGTSSPVITPQHNSQTANAEVDPQSQQIANECADLLKLATDLKKQVDNSTKDQLSVTVIREASQIEQLARKVKSENPKD